MMSVPAAEEVNATSGPHHVGDEPAGRQREAEGSPMNTPLSVAASRTSLDTRTSAIPAAGVRKPSAGCSQ
jgi:hypothetical protein